MNKFDKPYIMQQVYDIKKGNKLFDIILKLNTHELMQYSLINQVPLDYINEDGECLIHHVININNKTTSQQTKLNVIKFLIQNNVNPDQPNKYNQTPLHLACSFQLEQIIEYLLSINVNPNYQDNLGQTPFHYLLTGNIKLVESKGIKDFIQPPEKQNVEKKEKLMDIKDKLVKLINEQMHQYPILNTIKKTIINLLDDDDNIKNKNLEINDEIIKIILDISNIDKSSEIKKIIDIGKKTIEDKINNLFNSFINLDNFKIHKKDDYSWSPVNDDELAIIKNGKIKKIIKKDIHDSYKYIKENNDKFQVLSIDDLEDLNYNGFIDIFLSYILDNKKDFTKYFKPYNLTPNNDPIVNVAYIKEFTPDEKRNKSIRHNLALDNASCILDYDNLKYVGSSRYIEIIHYNRNMNENYDELIKIIDLNDQNKQILYLLGSPLIYDNINLLTDFNILENINTFDNTMDNDYIISNNWDVINMQSIINTYGLGGLNVIPFIDNMKFYDIPSTEKENVILETKDDSGITKSKFFNKIIKELEYSKLTKPQIHKIALKRWKTRNKK